MSKLTDAVRSQTDGHMDTAAAALALVYAEELDSAAVRADALKDLGPGLLRVLESLALTPKARASNGAAKSPTEPTKTPAAPSALEALRGQFAPRQDGAAPLDSAAS